MNEAAISYWNKLRFMPYPSGPYTTGFNTLVYGHNPVAPGYAAGSGWWADTAITTGEVDPTRFFYEIPGVVSITLSGGAFAQVNTGHQQSPSNVATKAPGRGGPVTAAVKMNFVEDNIPKVALLQPGPGGTNAGSQPGKVCPRIAPANGRGLFEIVAPQGFFLRTLGWLEFPTLWDAPDPDADGRMTMDCQIVGSGPWILFKADGTLVEG